jgi:hypothetical protein
LKTIGQEYKYTLVFTHLLQVSKRKNFRTLVCRGEVEMGHISIHVTYYSIGIYKKHVELYNNLPHYHLVVGLVVVHLT